MNEMQISLVITSVAFIRSNHGQSLAVVLVYLRMRGIPLALGGSAYLQVWHEEGALCVEC